MELTSKTGYIYKITSPNNKIYIGQTINPIQRKYQYKKKKFEGHIKLWNNCQAHNWNPSDTFEIIEECLCGDNKSNLNEREIYWINFYDSFKNGLNCNEGGNGNIGYKYSVESKKKISDTLKEGYESGRILSSAKGIEKSKEIKDKISVSLKEGYKSGEIKLSPTCFEQGHTTWNKDQKGLQEAWNKGLTGYYIHTEEIKENISHSLKERYSKQEHHLKGTHLTEEHKEKLRGKIPYNKGKIMQKFPCVHCGKMADVNNLKRWHNDNCRHKSLIIS